MEIPNNSMKKVKMEMLTNIIQELSMMNAQQQIVEKNKQILQELNRLQNVNAQKEIEILQRVFKAPQQLQ
ncbi:hypothetical protein [Haemophilus haemolyticus]|uniref:hypothetical protein n=1 Tax=Haemophilus haemolyticus TaxID=726 RepID=UPI0019577644|nr:hypothetical protein [Haemophilus haemolyticus]VTX81512.1 Uncharacterised protein [Haemophilus haemolyticus]